MAVVAAIEKLRTFRVITPVLLQTRDVPMARNPGFQMVIQTAGVIL
jgi:hypothetical protein